jgi:hypothetical protein
MGGLDVSAKVIDIASLLSGGGSFDIFMPATKPLYQSSRFCVFAGGTQLPGASSTTGTLSSLSASRASFIRRECLDHVIPLGVAHLRTLVSEYVEHYNLERNHQGLDNQLITSCRLPANTNGAIQRKQRLGGLLNYYYRGAA